MWLLLSFILIILSTENDSTGTGVANSTVFRGQTWAKRDQV